MVAGKHLGMASICPAGHWYNSTLLHYHLPTLSFSLYLSFPSPLPLISLPLSYYSLSTTYKFSLSLSPFFPIVSIYIYTTSQCFVDAAATLSVIFSLLGLCLLSLSLSIPFLFIYIIYIIPSRATVIGMVSLYEFYSLCGMPNGNPTGKEP